MPHLSTEPVPTATGEQSRPLRFYWLLILLVIVLVGGFLRFHNITRYEPFIADEAAYHLEARYLHSLIANVWKSIELKQEERKTGKNLWTRENEAKRFKEQVEGKIPWYARPGHIYLIALTMMIWGPEPVYLGGVVSALFGVLSIPLVFWLGFRLYGVGVGLLGAALFSLSGYQVAYAHTGLTEQDALFFVLVASLFHVYGKDRRLSEGRWKFLFATGLALGSCFVIHYRMVTCILAFFVWEAFFQPSENGKRIRTRLAAMSLLAAGTAVMIILTEIPYYLASLVVHMFFKAALPFQSYMEQLILQVFVSIYTNILSTQKMFSLFNLLTYPYLLWKLEGPLWPIVLAGAVGMCVWRRSRSDRWTLVLFLVPFLLCTFLQPRSRYACSFLVFGSLMIASVLADRNTYKAYLSGRVGRWSGVLLSVALLAASAVYAFNATRAKQSYGHAVDFIRSQGSPKHIATYPMLSQVHVGVRNVPDQWPQSEEDLRRLYAEGYRFLVVDLLKDAAALFFQQFSVETNPEFQERLRLLDSLESRAEPAFVVDNLHVYPIQNIFEVNHNFRMTVSYYQKIYEEQSMTKIRIYDLKPLYGEAGTPPGEVRPE
jgi:4-amino-4-deoxy-L-arabinose transferase-like glycosyltransferase